MADYLYPHDFPENLPKLKAGMFQYMVFQQNDAPPFYKPNATIAEYVGKPKGFKQVLYERGLWCPNMTKDGENKCADAATSMNLFLGTAWILNSKGLLLLNLSSPEIICVTLSQNTIQS